MKFVKGFGLASLGSNLCALAAVTSKCVGSKGDVCYQWGIPESSARSGSGDVYFQLRGPSDYSWVGLGIGGQMRGAQMFLIYTDGNGNVTLSTRSGTGHVEPEHVDMRGVELLAGSGVAGGHMTANIRCSSCSSLDLKSKNSWIAAWNSGGALDTTNTSHRISVHDDMTDFKVDFSQASIASDTNPFVGQTAADSSAKDPSSNNQAVSSGGEEDSNLMLAHGIIMLLVFAVMYPVGALLMPLLGRWYLHAGWQVIAFLLMWAGFGIGYVMVKSMGHTWTTTHILLGTIVVSLMSVQPVLGWLHHRHFLKHQQRGIISHFHIWYGRALMLLGIINGGLGIELAGASKEFTTAYAVLAGIFGIAYVGAAIFGTLRRSRSGKQAGSNSSMSEVGAHR